MTARTAIAVTLGGLLVTVACEGPPGPPGPPGAAEYEVVVDETAVTSVPSKQLQVDCPDGKRALGAGWSVLDSTSAILDGQATYFEPAFDGSHWLVNAQNRSDFAGEWKLRLRVICARVDTAGTAATGADTTEAS